MSSSNLKLGVEVTSAHDLTPKDKNNNSSSSCNAFVELCFDGHRFQTSTKRNDPDPVWNETFFFNVSDANNLPNLVLEAHVYNRTRTGGSSYFLGKVRITGTSFVPASDAVLLHYPLEKRSVFSSSTRGLIGLRVFLTDDPTITPFPGYTVPNRKKPEMKRRKFHDIPNQNQNQNQNQKEEIPRVSETSRRLDMKYFPVSTSSRSFYTNQSDYSVKEMELKPVKGRFVRTYDLVEPMQFLYAKIVKSRDLPTMDVSGSLDPFVEVKVGNFVGTTKVIEKNRNAQWNQVFAFAKDSLQSDVLEVVVKDKDLVKDDYVGTVRFDIREIPNRVDTESPLAAEWYRIENKEMDKPNGELMVAVWFGTQADEAFSDAIFSDAFIATNASSTRSKVYHSPRLWYVRVDIVEAHDLVRSDRTRLPDAYVKVQIGNQVSKTRPVQVRNLNAKWNEEFMFVAAEPFQDVRLVVSVEERVAASKYETLGAVVIPLDTVEKRVDDRILGSRWLHLEKSVSAAVDGKERLGRDRFTTRLHLRVCLDGGYHVLDESTYYSSDLRPTARQLWKPSIGVLELGVLSIDGLIPTKTRDGRGTCDAFCVAKYGHKWARTRTAVDTLNPKFNEQYAWEVYDPATVITIGVFDNNQISGSSSNNDRDRKIGKVRIRVSALESGRVYANAYPLIVLRPSGVKKMGDLRLAFRFSCTSRFQALVQYAKPLLPKMHYVRPLSVVQQEILRQQAVNLVAARLCRSEPALRKEVVEYISDAHSHLWSMRKSRANFFRVKSVFSGLLGAGKWFEEICAWRKPVATVIIHVLYMIFVSVPELILPTIFLYLLVIGLWNRRFRPKQHPHMDTRLSYADSIHPDELDEEFDTFPTSRDPETVRARYDRLRSVSGRVQKVVGDLAGQGERVQALLSWRDSQASSIFMAFCLVSSVVLYFVPFRVFVLLAGLYLMRHPNFRRRTPSAPVNFFRRLPAKTDCML